MTHIHFFFFLSGDGEDGEDGEETHESYNDTANAWAIRGESSLPFTVTCCSMCLKMNCVIRMNIYGRLVESCEQR